MTTRAFAVAILALSSLLTLTSCGANASSFASPEAAVKTFISAAEAKDADLLAQCFSKSRDEFKAFWNKTATDKELDQAKEMFSGATVEGVTDGEDGKKKVEVKLAKGSESLTMVKEGDNWLILDF